VLKRLERRGFIERRPDPRDGRRASLGLTARGRRLDVAAGTVEAAVNRALRVAGGPGVRAAGRVLRILAETLEHAQPL
jgi:DNA-binding MarR family transcriptional regulator